MDKFNRDSAFQAFEVIAKIVRAEEAEAVSDVLTEMLDEGEDDSETCVLLRGMKDAMRALGEVSEGLTASITLRASPSKQLHFAWNPAQPITEDFHKMISKAVAGAIER